MPKIKLSRLRFLQSSLASSQTVLSTMRDDEPDETLAPKYRLLEQKLKDTLALATAALKTHDEGQ